MTIFSFQEDCMIVDRGGAAYVGELVHSLKSPVSIHVSIWCVIDCPVQWDVVMDILGILLGLVNNYRRHEAFIISLVKDK